MHEILNYISTNSVMGIPLDIIAHFAVGAILLAFCKVLKTPMFLSFIFILAIAVGKEIHDISIAGANIQENIKDVVMTIIPFGIFK